MKKITLLLLISMALGAGSLVGEQFVEVHSFSWQEFHGIECIVFALHFFTALWILIKEFLSTNKNINLLAVLTIISFFQLVTNPWEDIDPWNKVHAASVLTSVALTIVVFFKK